MLANDNSRFAFRVPTPPAMSTISASPASPPGKAPKITTLLRIRTRSLNRTPFPFSRRIGGQMKNSCF